MVRKYVTYEVFEAPKSPKEFGTTVGRTPVFDQAKKACEIARQQGKSYGIAGITEDGERVVFL